MYYSYQEHSRSKNVVYLLIELIEYAHKISDSIIAQSKSRNVGLAIIEKLLRSENAHSLKEKINEYLEAMCE